jgi:hypothetical protein
MEIDPILPLYISIVEGMGTYALFLGSGTSNEALIFQLVVKYFTIH